MCHLFSDELTLYTQRTVPIPVEKDSNLDFVQFRRKNFSTILFFIVRVIKTKLFELKFKIKNIIKLPPIFVDVIVVLIVGVEYLI